MWMEGIVHVCRIGGEGGEDGGEDGGDGWGMVHVCSVGVRTAMESSMKCSGEEGPWKVMEESSTSHVPPSEVIRAVLMEDSPCLPHRGLRAPPCRTQRPRDKRRWGVKDRQRKGSGRSRKGSAKAVGGHGDAVGGQRKTVGRQWDVNQRQWKGSGRSMKGGGKAVGDSGRSRRGSGKAVGGQGKAVERQWEAQERPWKGIGGSRKDSGRPRRGSGKINKMQWPVRSRGKAQEKLAEVEKSQRKVEDRQWNGIGNGRGKAACLSPALAAAVWPTACIASAGEDVRGRGPAAGRRSGAAGQLIEGSERSGKGQRKAVNGQRTDGEQTT